MSENPQAQVKTVLFDLGGVLVNDIFEHILFDRHAGLAPHGWLGRRRWQAAALALWAQTAVQPDATEAAFWQTYAGLVGVPVDQAAALAAERQALRTNKEAAWLLPALSASGYRLGLVSDNTAFWCPKQLDALGVEASFDPALIFLSYQQATTKLTGLYAAAATKVDPATTLVVEDRPPLRRLARAAGFRVCAYDLSIGRSLAHALRVSGLDVPRRPATKST